MTDYSSQSYWDNRYLNEHHEIFEWYQTFESLKEKIFDYFHPEDKILNIGCGTSKLAEDLFEEGIKDVINVDYSEQAIKIMEERYQNEESANLIVHKKMDARDMKEFKNETFDIVFDKALLDSMLCGENALPEVDKMINEVYRVLKDGGTYIIISNSAEDYRKNLFDKKKWEYKVMEIEKRIKVVVLDEEKDKDPKNYHYIYVLKKLKEEAPKEEQKEEEKKEEQKEQK